MEKEKIEKEKIEKEEKKKEKIKILGIYCVAFALSTFFAFYIFFFLLARFMWSGIDDVTGTVILFGLPAVFLIGDFIYFLRRIKEKVEYDPGYALILFLSGTSAFLFFLKMIFVDRF